MKNQYYISFLLIMMNYSIETNPIVRSIKNNTPFLFTVVGHNDLSDCSLFNKGEVIDIKPYSLYEDPFLLGSEKPGLLLRPAAFYDKKNDQYYNFIDEDYKVDRDRLKLAYEAWKKSYNKRYKKGPDIWFAEWLCGDVSLIHNHVEIFGYILNSALVRAENDINFHTCMVDFSEGLFSRLLLNITINQTSKKGIMPHVKSFVGQGGFCQDGEIVLI